ncbi:MAG: oxidoreductase, partial [Chloroflexi bacterium]|nr:oxidoreductase [Chloroflexota bacterium]
IEAWRGAPMTVACDQFADMGDGYGFTLEVPPMHTGYAAVAFPWTGGRALKQDLLRIAQTAMIFALVKDRDGGRITINRAGQPIVDYWPSAYDRAHLIRGLQEAARIHAAGGAREVRSLHNTPVRWSRQAGDSIESYIERLASAPYQPNTFLLGSAHQMGTCRMGRDPRASVADPFGQAHGVQGLWIGDGSAFPTASGVNPMITIMGLAHRTARYIRESL